MIRLQGAFQRAALEILPRSQFQFEARSLLEADIRILTRGGSPRSELLEGFQFQRRKLRHRISIPGMLLDLHAVQEFCSMARSWLNLPIDRLGSVHFEGTYEFTSDQLPDNRLDLQFAPHSVTPRKTDWMDVTVRYVHGEDSGSKTFHIDYTCLAVFLKLWDRWFKRGKQNPLRMVRWHKTFRL